MAGSCFRREFGAKGVIFADCGQSFHHWQAISTIRKLPRLWKSLVTPVTANTGSLPPGAMAKITATDVWKELWTNLWISDVDKWRALGEKSAPERIRDNFAAGSDSERSITPSPIAYVHDIRRQPPRIVRSSSLALPVDWKAPLYGYSATGSRLDHQECALKLRNHGPDTDSQAVPSVLAACHKISKAMPPYPRCVLLGVEPAGTARGRITFLHRTSNVSVRGAGPTSSPDTSANSWRSRSVLTSSSPVHSGLLRGIGVFTLEGFIRGWVAVGGIKPRVQAKIGVAWEPARWADRPATMVSRLSRRCVLFDRERASVGGRAAFSGSTVLSESLIRQAIHG